MRTRGRPPSIAVDRSRLAYLGLPMVPGKAQAGGGMHGNGSETRSAALSHGQEPWARTHDNAPEARDPFHVRHGKRDRMPGLLLCNGTEEDRSHTCKC